MAEREFYKVADLAALLEVSERVVWDWIKDARDPLPVLPLGPRTVRIWRRDLDRWLDRRRRGTSEADRIVGELLV